MSPRAGRRARVPIEKAPTQHFSATNLLPTAACQTNPSSGPPAVD